MNAISEIAVNDYFLVNLPLNGHNKLKNLSKIFGYQEHELRRIPVIYLINILRVGFTYETASHSFLWLRFSFVIFGAKILAQSFE